jgi:hypothetical protein
MEVTFPGEPAVCGFTFQKYSISAAAVNWNVELTEKIELPIEMTYNNLGSTHQSL